MKNKTTILNRTQIEDLKANDKINIHFTNTKKLIFDGNNNLLTEKFINEQISEYFDENGDFLTNSEFKNKKPITKNDLLTKTVQMGKSESDTVVNIIKDIIDSSQKLKRYDIYIYNGSTSDDFYYCVI
jgi:hypothetical protein